MWRKCFAGGWPSFIGCATCIANSRHTRAWGQLFEVLCDWEIAPFDGRAADHFTGLRRQRVRVGAMDLKIASIALANDALLVTSNTRDFSRVPGLRCEDWLQP